MELPTIFSPVPGFPHLTSDTPVLAGMILAAPRSAAAQLFCERVNIRAGYAIPEPPVAIEATAVHDPDPGAQRAALHAGWSRWAQGAYGPRALEGGQ